MPFAEKAYTEIAKLVKQFKSLSAAQRRTMNEMQTRLGYILPLFSALGWNTSDMQEVSPEEKVSRGWVDFSFRLGGVPRFFLETKKVNEDLNDPRWVRQSIDYAWTKSVPWALLSDFEGLRVFNAEWQVSNPFMAEFIKFDLDTYLTDFDRLWWLSRSETEACRLDEEAEKVGKRGRRLPVSQHLFDDLKQWRASLYKDFHGFNPLYSPAQVDAAVLRTLNRLIFIRTAEDRQVEPNRLHALVREAKDRRQFNDLDKALRKLFREMDSIYNSELFALHLADQMDSTGTTLENIIDGLYERNFVRYNFNAIEADVLGTVYEQYLGAIVTGTPAESTASYLPGMDAPSVEERRQKRKSQGIYYTPSFVTKYIVQQTVGRHLDEHGFYPRPPRVLDMACGSGSFLIEAFDHLDRYLAKQTGHATGDQDTIHDQARRVQILEECIYGVDKDRQAVEVARLNLLLRALHSQDKLPLLTNIYHGDSLHPEPWDYFDEVMKEGGFDVIIGNPPYVRIQTLEKQEVEYFNQNYITTTGNYDIYILFVEKALQILRTGGIIGFILPNKFMQVDYGIGLRKLLSEQRYVQKIVDFGESQVFENATTYTCLLFLQKNSNPSFDVLSVGINEPKPTIQVFDVPTISISSDKITEKAWSLSGEDNRTLFDKISSSDSDSLLDLPCRISRGSSSGADNIFILERIDENHYWSNIGKSIELEPGILRTPLYATDFNRYQFTPKAKERIIFPYSINEYGYLLLLENDFINLYPKTYEYLHIMKDELEKRKDYKHWYAFSAPRNLNLHDRAQIVVPLLANKGSFSEISRNNAEYCLMASGGFSITVPETSSAKYVLGLMNSSLLFWFLKQISNVFRGGWITCTKQYIGQLPIRRLDLSIPSEKYAHDEVVRLVEEILSLNKDLAEAERNLDDRRFTLQKRIAQVDAEIDRCVYALYDLTPAEIKIIEGR